MISEPGEEASWFLVLSIPAGFILCLTWLFHRILSRFPFDFSGLWRWFTALIQMKFFEENFIFEVRVFIKIKIYSVTWFNVFKFYHFNSCQITQHRFILLLKQCRHLWMVKNCCYPKIWDFGNQFQTLLKKWLAEFVIFLFYFQNLTDLFIKSVYFILYFTNMCSCFLLFFSFLWQVWRTRDLAWPGARSRPRFLWFLWLRCKWRLVFGGNAGEKKPRILPGEERGTASSENSKHYLLFQENVSIFVFLPKHLLPGDGKWKTDHTKGGLISFSPSTGERAGSRSWDQLGPVEISLDQHSTILAGPLWQAIYCIQGWLTLNKQAF